MRVFPAAALLVFCASGAYAQAKERAQAYKSFYAMLHDQAKFYDALGAYMSAPPRAGQGHGLDVQTALESPDAYNADAAKILKTFAAGPRLYNDLVFALTKIRGDCLHAQPEDKEELALLDVLHDAKQGDPLGAFGESARDVDSLGKSFEAAARRLALATARKALADPGEKRLPYPLTLGGKALPLFENATITRGSERDELVRAFSHAEKTLKEPEKGEADPDSYLKSRAALAEELKRGAQRATVVMKLFAYFSSTEEARAKTSAGAQNAAQNEKPDSKPMEQLMQDVGWDDKAKLQKALEGLQTKATTVAAGKATRADLEKTAQDSAAVLDMMEKAERARPNPDAKAMAEIDQLRRALPADPARANAAEMKTTLAAVISRLPLAGGDSPLASWAKREVALDRLTKEARTAGAAASEGAVKDASGAERKGVWVKLPEPPGGEVFDSGDGLRIEKNGKLTTKTDARLAALEQFEDGPSPVFSMKTGKDGRNTGRLKYWDFAVEPGERYRLNKDDKGRITGVLICRKADKPDAPCDIREAVHLDRHEIFLKNGTGRLIAGEKDPNNPVLVFRIEDGPFLNADQYAKLSAAVREKRSWLLEEVPPSVLPEQQKLLAERFLISNMAGKGNLAGNSNGWKLERLLIERGKLELGYLEPGAGKKMQLLNLALGLEGENLDEDYKKTATALVSSKNIMSGCQAYAGFPGDYLRLHTFNGGAYAGYSDLHRTMEARVSPWDSTSVQEATALQGRKTTTFKHIHFERWDGQGDLIACSQLNWDKEDQELAIPGAVSKTLEWVFSPAQMLVYGISAEFQRGTTNMYMHRQYTRMQEKWIKEKFESDTKEEDRPAALYAMAQKDMSDKEKQELKSGLNEQVMDKRRDLWGEFVAANMGEVTEDERAAFAYDNFGMGNMTGYYFRWGQKQMKAGNTWSGVGAYAFGGAFLVGEGFAEGAAFGEISSALRLLSVTKYARYAGTYAGGEGKVLDLAAKAKATAKELELFEKTGEVSGRLKLLGMGPDEMKLVSQAEKLGQIEGRLMKGYMDAQTAASAAEFTNSLAKGDKDEAWRRWDALFSQSVQYTGEIAGWTAARAKDGAKGFLEWLNRGKESESPELRARVEKLKAISGDMKDAAPTISSEESLAREGDAAAKALRQLRAEVIKGKPKDVIPLTPEQLAALKTTAQGLGRALKRSLETQRELLERMPEGLRQEQMGVRGQGAAVAEQLGTTPIRFEGLVGEVGGAYAHMDPKTNEVVVSMSLANLAYAHPDLMATLIQHELIHAGDFNGTNGQNARVWSASSRYDKGGTNPEYAVTEALAHTSEVLAAQAVLKDRGIDLRQDPAKVQADAVKAFGAEGADLIMRRLGMRDYVQNDPTVFKYLLESNGVYAEMIAGIDGKQPAAVQLANRAKAIQQTSAWLDRKLETLDPAKAQAEYDRLAAAGQGKEAARHLDDVLQKGRYEMLKEEAGRYQMSLRKDLLAEANRLLAAAGEKPTDAAGLPEAFRRALGKDISTPAAFDRMIQLSELEQAWNSLGEKPAAAPLLAAGGAAPVSPAAAPRKADARSVISGHKLDVDLRKDAACADVLARVERIKQAKGDRYDHLDSQAQLRDAARNDRGGSPHTGFHDRVKANAAIRRAFEVLRTRLSGDAKALEDVSTMLERHKNGLDGRVELVFKLDDAGFGFVGEPFEGVKGRTDAKALGKIDAVRAVFDVIGGKIELLTIFPDPEPGARESWQTRYF